MEILRIRLLCCHCSVDSIRDIRRAQSDALFRVLRINARHRPKLPAPAHIRLIAYSLHKCDGSRDIAPRLAPSRLTLAVPILHKVGESQKMLKSRNIYSKTVDLKTVTTQ